MLKPFGGAGEMEEVLRALGALSEDPGCVFSTHITTYNTCNPGSWGFNTLCLSLMICMYVVHMCRNSHIHLK